jgi:uncharacterized integral membrane protein (TIGR00697 family)
VDGSTEADRAAADGAGGAATGRLAVGQVALVALFVTALVTAQLTASKLLAFSLPVALPVTGTTLLLPGAAPAYALTFYASDCYSELYGRRAAQTMVNVAFAANFVLLALVASTIAAPGANPEFAGEFAAVLAPSANVVAGSLLAYVVSQNWDVVVFHRIREATDGRLLWLRNVASTASSQAIDTVIFVGVAFLVAPTLLGVGSPLPVAVVASLIVGQYLLKLLIAVVDTPFVYLVVGLVRDRDGDAGAATAAR